MLCVLDQNSPIQIIENDVVSGETVLGVTTPADTPKKVFIHDIMNYRTVEGLLREIYSTIFITEQRVAISEDVVRAVNPNSLAASPYRVIDCDTIARPNKEADARVALVTKGKADHRHVVLAHHSDTVVTAFQLDLVAGRGLIVARVNIQHLGRLVVMEAGGELRNDVDRIHLIDVIFFGGVHATIAKLVAIHLDDTQYDGGKGGLVDARRAARGEDAPVDGVGTDDHHDARRISRMVAG